MTTTTASTANTVAALVARPYARVVTPGEDGVKTAYLLEIPGAVAEGDSYAEAITNLEEMLPDYFAAMLAAELDVPPPVAASEFSGRLQMRVPSSLHFRVAMRALAEDVSINRVLADAVAAYVGFPDTAPKGRAGEPRRRLVVRIGPDGTLRVGARKKTTAGLKTTTRAAAKPAAKRATTSRAGKATIRRSTTTHAAAKPGRSGTKR